MRRPGSLLVGLLVGLLTFVSLFAARTMAAGPVEEIEPNDTCATAQDLGALGAGITVNGTLDGSGGRYPQPGQPPNIDFFQLAAAPDSTLIIEQFGRPSQQGSLEYPFLGALDSACARLNRSSDSSSSGIARISVQVPADGILTIAATSCCDYALLNGGLSVGTYTLRVSTLAPIDSINGRALAGDTNEPIDDQARVELLRCEEDCYEIGVTYTDALGRFSFVHALGRYPYPPPDPGAPPYSDTARYMALPAGDYQVRLSNPAYEPLTSEIFSVAADERYELGDLSLSPLPQGREVRGRLVDATSGEPLAGEDPPYAYVRLYRCGESGCQNLVGGAYPANDGSFSFTRADIYSGLLSGRYQLGFSAYGYLRGRSEPFSIGDDETVDLGDVAVQPIPVGLSNPIGCASLPTDGGVCQYSVDVANLLDEPLNLQVWSVIGAITPEGDIYSTFQPQPAQQISLEPDQTRTLNFELEVPTEVPAGTEICVSVLVARDEPGGSFNPLARTTVFCKVKGGN